MTESQTKITAVKNSQDLNQLEEQYKTKIANLEQKALDWENAAITEKKAKDELEDDYKVKLKTTEQERDEWKNQAHASQRVYQSQEKTQKQNDFLTEFNKLQAKKGIETTN
ncbi:MAG: hypothetical protein GBAus27B_000425 [Mycoplasmataceae bacterium]|nr:MAG: hypothetical protein GBAus27B_000425 [Mycoplasmataceae bacterium]